MNKAYFSQLAGYNIWANNKVIDWLQEIDDVQWEQAVTSSFSSVKQTVLHIASAENVWIDFWNKRADAVFLSFGFNGTKEELLAIWRKSSMGMKDFIDTFPEGDYLKTITFKYPRGGEGHLKFVDTVAHVMNHSTYHRGQLVSALRQVGFTKFSSIDLASYYIQVL
jgi:uncharacterized damage-inducible protein DinB